MGGPQPNRTVRRLRPIPDENCVLHLVALAAIRMADAL